MKENGLNRPEVVCLSELPSILISLVWFDGFGHCSSSKTELEEQQTTLGWFKLAIVRTQERSGILLHLMF